ncbi:histidine phosphatase family protein [Microvirga calopogonii]|uniref:histidine phosphatase family protein n=1 Tax=Microvirga calopogonii TaxID=2078013 RepID=UPI000E0D1EAC|nr:histidine phosphatase family protein [Microvirga calopogonii]
MTTTFFLVRHAIHDRVGTVLCGRMAGVHLGSAGRAQAERLAHRFADESVAGIYTSPLERALETAQPIASRLEQPFQVCDAISEIEFGRWSGMNFEALGRDPLWSSWNASRGTNRAPEGETMLEVQGRIVGAMERMRGRYVDCSIVLVSHSDVIKAALLFYLGMPIDAYARIEVEPASVSTLVVGEWGSKLLRLNEVVAA